MTFTLRLAAILGMLGTVTLRANVLTQGFEDFATTTVPTNVTVNGWTINETSIRSSFAPNLVPRTGSNFALFQDNQTNGYVQTPWLTNGVGSATFYLCNRSGAAFTGPWVCELRISTNDVDWVTIYSATNSSTNWTSYAVPPINTYTPARLRFFRPSGVPNGSHLAIDDISITPPPAKVDISGLAISPTAPTADQAVMVSAVLTPSSLASNLVAMLRWSANGGSSNTISMTYNSGSGRYETVTPITNQPAFSIISYTVVVTFDGPTPLSPQTASGSFLLRQPPLVSAYSSFTVKGGLTNALELFDDEYWMGVKNVGALGSTALYFESVSSVSKQWRDPAQTRTVLPVFGTASTNAMTNIQLASVPAGWLMFSFDESRSRYGIQQADVQSFNTWTSAASFGNYTIDGWTLTQGRATNITALAFDGRFIQFASNTAERAITSPALTNGIGTLLFRYRNTETNGASPAAFAIQTRAATNLAWQTVETVTGIITPDYIPHRVSVDNLDLRYIRIAALDGTAPAQLLIDDIVITHAGATLAFSGLTNNPANPTITNTVEVSVNITPLNGAELATSTVTLWYRGADIGTLYSLPITFTNFAGRGTLTNFPALIKLNTSNTADYQGFLDTAKGYDLRFWTNNTFTGTQLDYEIEKFDASGNSFIWVKVPRLTHNTSIWATWGDPANNSQAAYTTNGAVWAEGYVGAWHLGEAVTDEATGGIHHDSTSYRHNGTQYSNSPASGISGTAQSFDGNSDYIDFGTNSALARLSDFTIEAWVNTSSTGAWYRQVIGNYGNTAASNFFGLGWTQLAGTPLGLVVRVNNVTTNLFTNTKNYKDGQWHHLVGTKQGSALALYIDGSRITTGTMAGNPFDSQSRVYMGTHNRTEYSQGVYDEPRISSAVRSTNWVWACFMNQGTSHNAFMQYGNVVAQEGVVASISGGIYDPIPMTNTTGNTYSATIPRGVLGQMEYYVEASYLNPATGGFQTANDPLDRTGFPAAYTNTDVKVGTQGFEDFATTTVPTNVTVNGWTINETSIRSFFGPNLAPRTGTRFALFHDSATPGASGTNGYVETPWLTNGVGSATFYLCNRSGAAYTGPWVCELRISTNDVDWVTINATTSSSTNWTAYTVPINIYTPVRLRFFRPFNEGNGSHLAIDDISMTYPPVYVTASGFDLHPGYPSQEEPTTVACTIASATAYHPAFNITGTLKYRVNDQISGWTDWVSVPMARNYGTMRFTADIPPQLNLSEVEYYVESRFKGYSAAGEDQSPMTFPETELDFTSRRYISNYERLNISIGTNEVTNLTQLGNGLWEGVITFLEPTMQPDFGIDSYGFYNGTNVQSGFSTWGDNIQFRTNMPLSGIATQGGLAIVIPELAEGQYIIRFDENTGIYSVQNAAFQDFENWRADNTRFGESFAGAEIPQQIQNFDTWEDSKLENASWLENFESGWSPVYAYPTNWVIPESWTTGTLVGYRMWAGIVVTQLVGQAGLLAPESSRGYLVHLSTADEGLGSFSFDLRCANPNDFRPAIYSSLTNETIMISARIKANDMPTNNAMNSIGYAYTSILGAYSDTNNYYELRITQTAANNRRFEIWQKSGGTLTRRSYADDNGKSITTEDTVSLLMYRTTGAWTLKAFLGTSQKVNTTSSVILTGKGIGLNAMDASPSVDWVNVYAITNANYSATSNIYTESFDSTPAGWDDSSGAWTASGGRYVRPGYTGSPLTAWVEYVSDPGAISGTLIDSFTNLTHTDYRRYTSYAHTATSGYIRVKNYAGNGYLIVDNVERTNWKSTTVSTNGWVATNVWVETTGKDGKGIEFRRSRTLGGASQVLTSPTLQGASVIEFDYRSANDATGPVSFDIEYYIPSQGGYQLLTSVTNSSPTNWVHFSYGINDSALRADISSIQMINTTAGHDDGLRIDNLQITELVPVTNSTWWAYNVLVTDVKPTGIVDNPPDSPWLAWMTDNRVGAFFNNSITNDTGGSTNNLYFPFIQSAYLPRGIGEIRFLYRAWDTNAATIQILASTNRYIGLPPPNGGDWSKWTSLGSVAVTNTAYQVYESAVFERDYRYVVLRMNGVDGGRVGLDNIMITAPLAADLRLSNLRTIPEIPLAGQAVHVEVTLDDYFFSPSISNVYLLYKAGTNDWGNHSASTVRQMVLVTNTAASAVYRSQDAFPIPQQGIDSVVQYQIKAEFGGFFAEKSSPRYYRAFENPYHYWPIDLNRNQPTNTPYYIVFSSLPGQVWINEFNIDDWDTYQDLQFIELAGVGNALIGNWRVESIFDNFTTNASYTIPGGTRLPGATDAFGFFVIGKTDVTPKNQTLTTDLPFNGGIQLVRPVALIGDVIEQQVSYDDFYGNEGFNMTLSTDHRYVFAGKDDFGVSEYPENTSLIMIGTGSNRADFIWGYFTNTTWSIGTTNYNQMLLEGPPPPPPGVEIASAWRNDTNGVLNFIVSSQATNLVPSVWYVTNLMNIVWQPATNGFGWDRTNTTYRAWCNEVPPPAFYIIKMNVP
jgi:hypothetical protein